QRGAGYFSTPRVSPKGDAVAFVRHNVKGDDRGVVALADLSGNVKVLTPDLPSVTGVAWSPDGSEVWLSAWMPLDGYTIEAVTPGGRRRVLYRSTERTRLFDVRGDTLLVGTDRWQAGVSGLLRGQDREQDLSFLDGTCATDLSASGDEMLFSEGSIGGGPGYSFFLRDASGTFPVRLGTGWGSDLSSDGKWTLSYPVDPPMKLTITPTGTGTPQSINLKGFEAIGGANWFPDGKRVLFWGSEKGTSFRGYVMDLPDGKPRAITPPGVTPTLFTAASYAPSPDGRLVVVNGADGKLTLYPVDGGEPRTVPGTIEEGEMTVAWTGDGKGLLVREEGVPSKVYRVDVETGRRSLWKELRPADPSGVVEILGVVVTPDLEHYAYTYMRVLTDLYTITGVK
ncbi:MAG TPA: hypothetical protein VNI57_09555, partial [Candidatus Saccharimonadales bacterium]|nr:hypothetical protein [Candidatus Saccharimonadales bacterium]